jgi:hypothetical protein
MYVMVLYSFHVGIAVALEHLVRIWDVHLALYVDEAFCLCIRTLEMCW